MRHDWLNSARKRYSAVRAVKSLVTAVATKAAVLLWFDLNCHIPFTSFPYPEYHVPNLALLL